MSTTDLLRGLAGEAAPTRAGEVERLTTATVQRALARLLGGEEDAADAAVAALDSAGVLGRGVVLPALLVATRKGTDAAGALELLAEGQAPPTSWSDYEHRVIAEEAAEELDMALGVGVKARGAPPVRLIGVDAPLHAVAAVRAGAAQALAGAGASAPVTVLVEQLWVRRLCLAAGVDVLTPRAGELPTGTSEEPVGRLDGYLDPLEEIRR